MSENEDSVINLRNGVEVDIGIEELIVVGKGDDFMGDDKDYERS